MATQTNNIKVNLAEFLNRFIYFRDKGIGEKDLTNAYVNAGDFISTQSNTIGLVPKLQVDGIYLACAHWLYLELNPNVLGGMINSTNQGSESISFQQKPVKNWIDYYFGLSSYGIQLLAILQTVQPPLVNKKLNLYPYYGTIGN